MPNKKNAYIFLAVVSIWVSWGASSSSARPTVDWQFQPNVEDPLYPELTGPIVLIDESHSNYHTMSEGYWPFAAVLENDGYIVGANRSTFTLSSLASAQILVVANALHVSNEASWDTPVISAFTESEINAVIEHVRNGGSLFLIFDHMPFSGAVQRLANRFEVGIAEGYIFEHGPDKSLLGANFVFQRSQGDLAEHPITRGRNSRERVGQVATFTGSAMLPPRRATSILSLDGDFRSWNALAAWEFESYESAQGWSQLIAFEYGDGRVVMAAEAAMFTSQRVGRIGLRHQHSKDNEQLLLNILHWLSGEI